MKALVEAGVLQQIPIPILAVDGDLRVVAASACYCEQLAVEEASLRDVPLFALHQGAWDQPGLRQAITSASRGRAFSALELRLPDRLGGSSILVSGRAAGEAGQGLLITFQRVPERRLDADALAAVSSELRTPLSVILLHAEVMARRGGPSLRAAQVIERNAKALVRIIDDIADLSRISNGNLRLERTTVDFTGLVQAAVDAASKTAGPQGVRVSFDSCGGRLPVVGDATRLLRAVANLLAHSLKFSQSDSEISVRVRQDGSQALLTVSDQGARMTPDVLPRILDLFAQDHRWTAGRKRLALGLAIVRHVVEAHAGTVQALTPRPDSGSTFTVTLPLEHLRPAA
jgi:signal transduction histidine kinase